MGRAQTVAFAAAEQHNQISTLGTGQSLAGAGSQDAFPRERSGLRRTGGHDSEVKRRIRCSTPLVHEVAIAAFSIPWQPAKPGRPDAFVPPRATRICTHTAERPARPSYWSTRTPAGLLADAAVDALPQQVGMAVVAGVLLDHVDQELPQRDRLPGAVTPDEAEIGVTSELLGEGDLVVPCSPGILNNRLIGHGAVEVTIGLDVGLVASGYVLAREPLPEPLPLDIGHVAHQTQQESVDGSTDRRASCSVSRPSHLIFSVRR